MATGEEKLSLAAEQVRVDRRTRETGRVQIDLRTVERFETVPLNLAETTVAVERVPVGRFVETAPEPRVEGDLTIIPVVEERAVVSVRLFLREELHIRRQTERHTESHDVRLRRQQATVTRVGAGEAGPEGVGHAIGEGKRNHE